jgi:serine protease Do
MSAVGPSADYEVQEEFGLQAFLGVGAVFGTVHIPDDDLPMIAESKTPTRDANDPMKALRGELNVDFADVCVLKTQPLKNELHTLPAGLDQEPKVGDRVVALGFPEISALSSPRLRLSVTLVEGLYASYGRIVNLYPDGRDRTNKTPAFEVEAHWPSGMSGGPVINENGKVIGIVSRSLEASTGFAGSGLASWLGRLPELQNALRTFLK